jgi:hypothetical protein
MCHFQTYSLTFIIRWTYIHCALKVFAILSIYITRHTTQCFIIFGTIVDLLFSLGLYETSCDLNVKFEVQRLGL